MENAQTERPAERLIRIGEVKRLTGISTATVYRKISVKEFPRPVRLGANACAWPLSEVQDWIARRIALRDNDESEARVGEGLATLVGGGPPTKACRATSRQGHRDLVTDATEEQRVNPETPRPRCRTAEAVVNESQKAHRSGK